MKIAGSKSVTALIIAVVAIGGTLLWYTNSRPAWSDAKISVLQSLSLDSLKPVPADFSNAVADDPLAADFGHQLFFDRRLSANNIISCATCHQPARGFTDGLSKARAIGQSARNTPSLIGAAYSPWYYWDGRKDSQWSQALSPLEDPVEHGSNRIAIARVIIDDATYKSDYEQLFGPVLDVGDRRRFPEHASPIGNESLVSAWNSMSSDDQHAVNTVFANVGKLLAAYQRQLLPGRSRFDDYVDAVVVGDEDRQRELFTNEEARGLSVFIGDGRCTECHNGPLFTNNEFHNTGVLSAPGELPDRGRVDGLREVLDDPFNCLGVYSDDPQQRCAELTFVRDGIELIGATRTPSLRNLADTVPYSRKGQTPTLEAIVEHYDDAPLAMIGHNEAEELGLNFLERRALVAFLNTLDAPPSTPKELLAPPAVSQ